MTYIYAPTQEYPFAAPQIANAYPNTSFPRDGAARDAAFAERGYHRVVRADEPAYDPATHKVVKHTTPALVDGTWTLGWDVVALTQEELAARLCAVQGNDREAAKSYVRKLERMFDNAAKIKAFQDRQRLESGD
jgi:hypothetical protein